MACACVASLWLVIFNIMFGALGGGIITLGAMLRFNTQLFETYILDVLSATSIDGVNLNDILQSVAIVVMVFGFIILLIALMGLIGGCCKVKMALTIYGLIMTKLLVIILGLVIAVVVMKDQIDSRIKSAAKPVLNEFYIGWANTDPVNLGWNFIFTKFGCCGVDDYNDLATATNWLDTGVLTPNGNTENLIAPFFCCKDLGVFPNYVMPATDDCAVAPNTTISNYQTGCYIAIENYIREYETAMLCVISITCACMLMNVITSCMVKKGIDADEEEDKQKKNNKVGNDNQAWA